MPTRQYILSLSTLSNVTVDEAFRSTNSTKNSPNILKNLEKPALDLVLSSDAFRSVCFTEVFQSQKNSLKLSVIDKNVDIFDFLRLLLSHFSTEVCKL